jgi:mono/diheme cytochrome c family protein
MNKVLAIFTMLLLISCGSDDSKTEQKQPNPDGLTDFEMVNGIGPVKEKIELGQINMDMAAKGEEIFNIKCAACHKLDERFVGPPQRYTADRRSPEYILNMIMNPDEMTRRHPTGKEMLTEYLAPMTNMNLKMEEARQVLEYLRSVTKEGHDKNLPVPPVFKNKK